MDYQPVVDEIRSFVQSVDQTLTDRVREVAVLYAQACNEVNQRLRRCEEFLQKGLRSEAVHLAETQPAVLDQLAILDFMERPQWDELAMMYGLPAAPQLRVQAAAAINEAYADEQPLEELLRKHRLLALTRGSLKGRISVMRRIAELDLANAVWPDDIRNFEKQRFRQMQNDLSALADREDYESLSAIAAELQSTVWLSALPSALVRQVEGTKNRLRKGWASNTLRNLEGELNEAINTFDLQKARELREKWKFIAKDADLAEGDPILERASLAFEWLKDQDIREANNKAFQDHLDELENSLDKGAAKPVIDQAYRSAMEYGREIPPAVESRYRSYVAEQEAKRNRQRRILTIVAAVGSLLVLGLIALWAYDAHQTRKVEEAVASLKKMLDGNQIVEARSFLDKLEDRDNHTSTNPQIIELRTKLIELEKKEQERARQFWQALEKAKEEEPLILKSPGIEEAERKARTDREWKALQEVVDKRKLLIEERLKAEKKSFQDRINDLDKQIQALSQLAAKSSNMEMLNTELSRLQMEFARILEAGKGANFPDRLDQLRRRLDDTQFVIKRKEGQRKLEKEISSALVQPDDFVAYSLALAKYRNEFPNIKRSADFEIVMKEKSLWQSVFKWNVLASLLPDGPFFLLPDEVKVRAESCQSFLKDYPGSVNTELAEICLKCLEAAGERNHRLPRTAAFDLGNIFEGFLIKDVWIVKTTDNQAYYSKNKVVKKDPLTFQRITGFGEKDHEGKTLNEKNVAIVDRAPQSLLADKIRAQLPLGPREKTWIETTVKISEMILDDKETDAILRVVLLKKMIDYAGRGSCPLWLVLQKQRDYLEKIELNLELPWMNPENDEVNEGRRKAEQILENLPSLKSVPEKAVRERDRIALRVKESKRELVGWLALEEAGWQCRSTSATPGENLTLFVLVPAHNARPVWQKIGTLKAGKLEIQREAQDFLLEGRLVFGTSLTMP